MYTGFSGPTDFGTGSFIPSQPEIGQAVGLNGAAGAIFLDPTYVSGTAFGVSTATFANTTLASLGLTPGTYVYRFGTGATADSFTVNIGQTAAVPEPATWGMMILGFGMVGAASRSRKVKTSLTFA